MSRLQCKTPRGCSLRSQGLPPSLFHPELAPPCLERGHGQILITWQSHSRRLHRFPSHPRPAPQTALLLPHGPSFTLGAKKKEASKLAADVCEATWALPPPIQPLAETGYGRNRRCLLLPCRWLLSPPLTPQITQPKKLLDSWRFEGDFSTSTERKNFSCTAICVTAM